MTPEKIQIVDIVSKKKESKARMSIRRKARRVAKRGCKAVAARSMQAELAELAELESELPN